MDRDSPKLGPTIWLDTPLPPARLRYLTTGGTDEGWFFDGGKLGADVVRPFLEGASVRRVLDFGCGAGRILRHLQGEPGIELFGAELDQDVVAWCQANLEGTTVLQSTNLPPLDLEDESIDLIYGFSVLTHMGSDAQRAWLDEMQRLLRPGGTLLLSLHGEPCAAHLSSRLRSAFDDGATVVLLEREEFSNWCLAYHPANTVPALVEDHFTIVEHRESGAAGNPPQDLWVLRKR